MLKLTALFALILVLFFSCKTKPSYTNTLGVDAKNFDTIVGGKKVALYFLKNKNNTIASVTNYGARMVSFVINDKNNKPTDIVVGHSNIHDFIKGAERYFGAIVGRYGNRIAKGKFALDGKTYQLATNNAPNALHGGPNGFHSVVWDVVSQTDEKIVLQYLSKDGDEGYPGTLTTKVTYSLLVDNTLQMDYEMTTDKKTVVNITNHNYWNLNGIGTGTINNHLLKIAAANITAVDSTLIPNALMPVANTPFDFTNSTSIGKRIEEKHQQLQYGKGYDHNYVLAKGMTTAAEFAAEVIGDKSGIKMTISTTEPGIQFYGGNFMQSKNNVKGGGKDVHRTAFCLETQHFPDAPNQPQFLSTVLDAGKTYKSTTIHKFSVQ